MNDFETPSPLAAQTEAADQVTITQKQLRMLKLAMAIVLNSANRAEGTSYNSLDEASVAVGRIFDEVITPPSPAQRTGFAH